MNSSLSNQNYKKNSCRICLTVCGGNKLLSDTVECSAKKTIALLDLILKVANVSICLQKEILPSSICRKCIKKLIRAYELIQMIKESEQTHVQHLQWTLTKQQIAKTAEEQSNLKSDNIEFEDTEYLEEECPTDTEQVASNLSEDEEEHTTINQKQDLKRTLHDKESTEPKAVTNSLQKIGIQTPDERKTVASEENGLQTLEAVWCDNLHTENESQHVTPYNESAAYAEYRKALEKKPKKPKSDRKPRKRVKKATQILTQPNGSVPAGRRTRNRGITDMSKALKCDKCARFFSKEKTYKTHIETAHQEILSEEQIAEMEEKLKQKMEQEGKTIIYCPYCLQGYVRKDCMKRHIVTYHPDKVTLDNIEEHNMASDCEMEAKLPRNVNCDICGKIVSQAGLKNHKLRHTAGELPYHCNVCNQSFARKNTLYEHRLRHSGKLPYKCEICNKAFISNSQLKRHVSVHTNFRPFACSFCGKKFRAGSYLKAHLRQHTGERPFQCSVCSKNYPNYNSLKSHKQLRDHYDEEFLKEDNVEQLSQIKEEAESMEFLEASPSEREHLVEEYLSDVDVGNFIEQEMCP